MRHAYKRVCHSTAHTVLPFIKAEISPHHIPSNQPLTAYDALAVMVLIYAIAPQPHSLHPTPPNACALLTQPRSVMFGLAYARAQARPNITSEISSVSYSVMLF